MSYPWAREFAGIANVAEPAVNAVAADMYVPLARVIVPVAAGMGLPVNALTETERFRGRLTAICDELILKLMNGSAMAFTALEPVPPVYVESPV